MKREDRESRLCDCCYSGKGTAIVVWNLIGMCERAVPRRRRWQEMREAEQDESLVSVREGRQHMVFFDTRQEQEDQKARRRKRGYRIR